MQVTFLSPGKFKSPELRDCALRFTKLTSRFVKTEFIELSPSKKKDLETTLTTWINHRANRVFLTILDERGREFKHSRDFAKQIESIKDSSPQDWIILLGTESGFSEEFRAKSQLLWSLSKLTMAHELALVVAAEQVFRGFSILNNHPYHNE